MLCECPVENCGSAVMSSHVGPTGGHREAVMSSHMGPAGGHREGF